MEVQKSPDSRHQQYSEKQLSPVREICSQDSLRALGAASKSFATSFDRLTSFGTIHFDKEVKSKGLTFVKRIVDRNRVLLHLWNEILVMLCVVATSLDPLFCYILLVDKDKGCVGFDIKLRTIAVVLRSITDFLYIILIVFHFYFGYSSFHNDTGDGNGNGNGNSNGDGNGASVWTKAWRLLFSYFTVDVLAVLPLPQVVALFFIPHSKRLQFIFGMRALKYILLTQYLPRVFRIYSFLKKVRWTSSILPETAGAKAAFNLFLYMLASHVIGAFWYLFTIERTATCWHGRCKHCPLNCNYVLGKVHQDDYCSAKDEKGLKTFDFGIFKDALHIVDSRDFIRKISYCYWWGLQKLSSLGQDLKTSDHLWEIYFAIAITISGLVLFALLVGNLQTYLQSTIARLEEMRLKGQDIELWMSYHSLPPELKKKIKKYEQFKWRETKGVDVEQLLHNLPRDLKRETKRHLCLSSLLKVSKLQNMDGKLLDAICEYLKPMLYIERNFIIQEGEPLDEMVFIIQGKVLLYSKSEGKSAAISSVSKGLTKDDFYGEALLDWALHNPNSTTVPISTKTIRAHSKVEAFVLLANDLKTVVSKFWWLFSRNSPSLKEIWTPWAVLALQLAFRRYYKRRLEMKKTELAMERKNSELAMERKNSELAMERKKSLNLVAPLLTNKYIIRALRAFKKKAKRQAESSRV